jgi:hypothetical protein
MIKERNKVNTTLSKMNCVLCLLYSDFKFLILYLILTIDVDDKSLSQNSEYDDGEDVDRGAVTRFTDDIPSEASEYVDVGKFDKDVIRGVAARLINNTVSDDVSEESEEINETLRHRHDTGEVLQSDEMIKEHLEEEYGTCDTFFSEQLQKYFSFNFI